jgi:hypothetical protein
MMLKGWTILVGGLLSFGVACSSSDETDEGVIGHGDGKGTGGSGAGGDLGTGGLDFPDTGGATGNGAATGSGGGTDAPTCAATVYSNEALPVDIYIMFDQSTSMGDPVPSPGTGTWWDAATTAVGTFANEPRAAQIGVGIQYFPLGGIAPASCQANYKTPEVEVGVLPGNAGAIVASLQKHGPNGLTPSGPSLQGAIDHMKEWGPAHPGRAPIVVFVTDGFPTECTPDQPTGLAQLAKAAFETEPKVRTFVVGFNLGLGKENLNQIAEAGGTGQAFFINGGDIGGQFVDAMLSITDTPLQCTFDIPTSTDPMNPTDPKKVQVVYTPRSTGAPQEVPKLNTLGDCSLNNGQGWFYDNLQTPKSIQVCPGTCKAFSAGVVQTKTGCAPVPGRTM